MKRGLLFCISMFFIVSQNHAQYYNYNYTAPSNRVIGISVANRFGGVAFLGNYADPLPLYGLNTILIEVSFGRVLRQLYTAIRINAPYARSNGIEFPPKTIIGNSTQIGIGFGGGFGFGKINTVTGKGSVFMTTFALTFDFGLYSEVLEISSESPGFFTWGIEMMNRYQLYFNERLAFIIGVDIGYGTTCDQNAVTDLRGIVVPSTEFYHIITFGGTIGLKF